jgi:prepilin signal peptidase PulO-like enzyme (type II secretory pathway)
LNTFFDWLSDPFVLQALAFIFGLAVGSFLNVLALRTLDSVSVLWPPSQCPVCLHKLAPTDNIPVVSYMLLRGRCRYCGVSISWQYPVVELVTGISFWFVVKNFGLSFESLGTLFFASTLITVTVTDFRERLIPHDITYPSMLVGILYSALVRQDLLGALAGIGVSYIIFDFLAHYGLKVYLKMVSPEQTLPDLAGKRRLSLYLPAGQKRNYGSRLRALKTGIFSKKRGPSLYASLKASQRNRFMESPEEFSVMGGGDAVLSAVIAAYLGWQRLALALAVGFIVGTIMGLSLLLTQIKDAGLLQKCYRSSLKAATIGGAFMGLTLLGCGLYFGAPLEELPWLPTLLVGAFAGAMMGFVAVGTRVSKPYPFGPALAMGAFVAIFVDPAGILAQPGA